MPVHGEIRPYGHCEHKGIPKSFLGRFLVLSYVVYFECCFVCVVRVGRLSRTWKGVLAPALLGSLGSVSCWKESKRTTGSVLFWLLLLFGTRAWAWKVQNTSRVHYVIILLYIIFFSLLEGNSSSRLVPRWHNSEVLCMCVSMFSASICECIYVFVCLYMCDTVHMWSYMCVYVCTWNYIYFKTCVYIYYLCMNMYYECWNVYMWLMCDVIWCVCEMHM